VAAAGPADPVGVGRAEFPFGEVDIREGNHHTAAAVAVHTVPGLKGHRTVPTKSILVAVHLLRHRRLQIPSSDWLSLVPKCLRKKNGKE
jgi:hypothetical protein